MVIVCSYWSVWSSPGPGHASSLPLPDVTLFLSLNSLLTQSPHRSENWNRRWCRQMSAWKMAWNPPKPTGDRGDEARRELSGPYSCWGLPFPRLLKFGNWECDGSSRWNPGGGGSGLGTSCLLVYFNPCEGTWTLQPFPSSWHRNPET